MATLVIRNPDGTEQEHEVAQQLTIGRAEGNDLVLAEGGVSRNHARFFVEGDELMVEDVGSSNGTWVDGRRIDAAVPLTAQSQIVIGDYEVSLKRLKKPRPSSSRSPVPGKVPRSTRVVPAVKGAGLAKRSAPGRASGPQLRGLTGGVTGKVFALSGSMMVGRVSGTDLTIDDDSVSRKHAELEVRGREVIVRDLGSANGTTVNGAPITEDTLLSSGDVVQFGVVELMFETSGSNPMARASAPRRATDRPARRSRNDFPESPDFDAPPPPMDPRRKRLLIISSAVITVLCVAVLAKALTADPDPIDHQGQPVGGRAAPKHAASDDPAAQIDDLMTECRAYSSPDMRKPDWKRAKAACEKVIDLEPIHSDAIALLKRIQIEKACEENLEHGRELAITGQVEASIDAFAKVGAKEGECPTYALRALTAAKEPVAEVKKLAGRECKDYSINQKWENAYKRCELYMRLACQTMDDKDLYAPALMTLRLDGRLGKGDWRPSDPLYINFLKARARLKPDEPPWRCPVIPSFRPPQLVADPYRAVKAEFVKRFKVADMGESLVRYFDGRPDAVVPLQKITENMNKAEQHEDAKKLLGEISMAQNLLNSGLTEITNDKPERAAAPFRKALEVDEKLVLGAEFGKLSEDARRRELERRASFVRRTITETMASTCLTKGRISQDRKDTKEACHMWKLGASFNRGHVDLLRALSNVCTKRAEEVLARAHSCEQLRQVVEFAVDGDGLRQKAEERLESEGCGAAEN